MAAAILLAAVSNPNASDPLVSASKNHASKTQVSKTQAPNAPTRSSDGPAEVLHLVSMTLPPPPSAPAPGGSAAQPVADISRPQPNMPSVAKPIAPKEDEEPRASSKVTAPKAPRITAPAITTPGITPMARVVRPTRRDARDGAALLDAMARGEAPGIRIAWPDYRAERDRLRGYLERCAGWRVLLSTGAQLWSLEEEPGTPWTPRSTTSGYMRLVGGTEATVAAELIDRIRQRHDLTGGQTVAVATRSFDARLIGGLANLLGEEAVKEAQVSGRYVIEGSSVHVSGLRVGGRPAPGAVDLGRISRCG
jgi:hypothetical protein